MSTLKNQQGLTFFGLLIILGLIAFFALVTLKVVPLYVENGSINSTLDALPQTEGVGKKGKKAMMKQIDAQFYINDVKSISAKDITFEKSKESKVWNVSADYEARVILFKNVGVFIDFKKTVEVPR